MEKFYNLGSDFVACNERLGYSLSAKYNLLHAKFQYSS